MRPLALFLILAALAAIVWLLAPNGPDDEEEVAPEVASPEHARVPPAGPEIRAEGPTGPKERIGLYRPDAAESHGPPSVPSGLVVRLPEPSAGQRLSGKSVLEAVSRVVPIRGRTEEDLRALASVALDEGWGVGPDPVPLEEVLDVWRARGIDVQPRGRVLVVVERLPEVPLSTDGR